MRFAAASFYATEYSYYGFFYYQNEVYFGLPEIKYGVSKQSAR